MKHVAKRYDTKEVIAVSQAIFREAGNQIVREGLVSSRDKLDNHFNGSATVVVTDEDRALADTILTYVQQRTTMNALTGARVAEFVTDVITLTEKDTVSERDFGRIVWLPKLYTDMLVKDDAKIELAHYTVTSRFVGKIKDKLEIDFTPLTVMYHREYNCFRHLGHDGHGNLIGFLNKKRIAGPIKGRVKKQEVSRYHGNAKVTYLSYVQENTNGS